MTENSRIPVTVIGGYLGAGKTTLINHLLRHADGRKLAILVNEFGDLPIDADLIETRDENMITLSGGCVCCSYGSDLSVALADLAQSELAPDQIVLEASGVALPGSILASIGLMDGFDVDCVVVMADAEKVQELGTHKFLSDTIVRQLEEADFLLVNKIDLVDAEQCAALKPWLSGMAPNATLIETRNAIVDPALIMGTESTSRIAGENRQGSAHGHSIPLETRSYIPEGPVVAEELAQNLISKHPGLVRAKGFVETLSGDMATIQIVGKRFSISKAPPSVKPGLVLISLKSGR